MVPHSDYSHSDCILTPSRIYDFGNVLKKHEPLKSNKNYDKFKKPVRGVLNGCLECQDKPNNSTFFFASVFISLSIY